MSSIYMKIDGIDGPVTAQGLQNYVELKSFDFSVLRKMNTAPGQVSDREGTKPAISDIVVSKHVDKASPHLFQQATTGKTISQIVLKFVNTGSNLSEYLTVTIKNVIVSKFEISEVASVVTADGETKQDKPVESLGFNFDNIEIKFTPYDDQHNAQAPIPAGYDLKTAKAA